VSSSGASDFHGTHSDSHMTFNPCSSHHRRMPRYLPDHLRQRQHYLEDLRKRVIYQRYTLEKKVGDIAIDLNMSKCAVERVLQLWRETGEVVPVEPDQKKKRKRIMTAQEMDVSTISCIWLFDTFTDNFHYSFLSSWSNNSPIFTWTKYSALSNTYIRLL
jgi:hypothetical protein